MFKNNLPMPSNISLVYLPPLQVSYVNTCHASPSVSSPWVALGKQNVTGSWLQQVSLDSWSGLALAHSPEISVAALAIPTGQG